MKCPECGETKQIRPEIQIDESMKLLYYRCKECGFMWDENEVVVKQKI